MQFRASHLSVAAIVAVTALVQPNAITSLAPQEGPDLEERVRFLEETVVNQDAQLAELSVLTKEMVKACVSLDRALENSRINGFEWAGPNPQSKTDLLDGLSAFARTLEAAASPPKQEEEGEEAVAADGG